MGNQVNAFSGLPGVDGAGVISVGFDSRCEAIIGLGVGPGGGQGQAAVLTVCRES